MSPFNAILAQNQNTSYDHVLRRANPHGRKILIALATADLAINLSHRNNPTGVLSEFSQQFPVFAG